jgi:hypothetical protein
MLDGLRRSLAKIAQSTEILIRGEKGTVPFSAAAKKSSAVLDSDRGLNRRPRIVRFEPEVMELEVFEVADCRIEQHRG